MATEQIPDWILSNYFYREMALVIRVVLAIFLFLLASLAALAFEVLRRAGVVDANVVLNNTFMRSLGFVEMS